MTPHRVVADRCGIPLPRPFTYRRIFRLLASLHREFCGRSSSERTIRVYWMFGILCSRPCYGERTTHIYNLTEEQLSQLIPIQTLYRSHRGRRYPVRPMTDRFVWNRHLEGYLAGATLQEREERLMQLRNLQTTMEYRMQNGPCFEVFRQRQALQHHMPRRSYRLRQ